MPITGTPISSDFVSTSFDADGNRRPILDVALLHNRDSGSRIAIDLIAEAVAKGSIILPDANGELPDPSLDANQGRFAVSGNQFLHAIDRGAHDKIVAFKEYGPDRVVLTGEPALLEDEADFGGSFAVPPPIGNYSAGDYVWDYGSQVWLTKYQSGSTTWLTTGGPHGYAPGHIYSTEAVAASHVTGVGYFHLGGVVIYGQGSAQKPYVITGYTAPGDHLWHWDPIGLTIGDVQDAIGATDITGLADTPNALGTAGQVWKVNAAGDALEAADETIGRRQVHVLLASNYQLSNRRIAANLPTGETEELGDIHTFLVPSIIGSETSGTAVTLYVGIGAAHTIIKPNGDDVYPADLEAGTRYWVQAIATSYVLIEEPGTAGTLFGRGEPPEATAARVGLQYLDLISKVVYGCFDDPHRTAESTGDFDDINRSDIEINLNDRLEDITVVENEWLYRVASNRFYAGTDVGASQLAWVDDTADDALAASLVTNTDEVVWLGRHIDNEEALRGLTAIETGKEYFFYREQDGDIVRLDNSSFSAAGSTVAHPFWFPVKADDREEHVFDARDGLPTLANDGSDDNRIGVTNTGVYIVDVDPISATDPTAGSWADYAATDYEGAFAADPTIDTGHWYANYVRRTFREFESTNFGLGWIPHDAPVGFIGWYQSRQDALNHAAERGVVNSGNFVAYTGSGTVETATNFTAATSARIQRNWIFVPVGAGDDTKADTDLQNIDTDLTSSEQSAIRTRIGAVGAGDTVTTAPILDLPANAITVETGTLYHGDGIYSIYVYTPTSDFPLTAETRPETGADWQTMWAPVVAGVKEVTAYPAPSAVHDRDVRKIFFQRDTSNLPTDLRHLKSVDAAMFVLTTGSTSSSHGRRYGYERDQYGR